MILFKYSELLQRNKFSNTNPQKQSTTQPNACLPLRMRELYSRIGKILQRYGNVESSIRTLYYQNEYQRKPLFFQSGIRTLYWILNFPTDFQLWNEFFETFGHL